jgi:hypothetical protein
MLWSDELFWVQGEEFCLPTIFFNKGNFPSDIFGIQMGLVICHKKMSEGKI